MKKNPKNTAHKEHCVVMSVKQKLNVDFVLDRMFQKLDVIRVYTKPKGRAPDLSDPIVLRSERCTVQDICLSIHKDIIKKFRYALVWGRRYTTYTSLLPFVFCFCFSLSVGIKTFKK